MPECDNASSYRPRRNWPRIGAVRACVPAHAADSCPSEALAEVDADPAATAGNRWAAIGLAAEVPRAEAPAATTRLLALARRIPRVQQAMVPAAEAIHLTLKPAAPRPIRMPGSAMALALPALAESL